MKVWLCFLFVFVNIKNNGRASVDSVSPARSNILFDNSDKSCYRPCKFNAQPRRCSYNFRIEPSLLDDGRPAITINGMSPGPPIHVCINDVIVVEVTNKIPDQDLTIHWHGVEQKGSPYMDGVPMVTQCPIAYGATFKYAFIASSSGTFFYHADSVMHQSDGVYGALIVNPLQPLEPHFSLYDYDRSQENTLLVAAKFPKLLTANLEDLNEVLPSALLINGIERDTKLFVLPGSGYRYRLRLVNAIAIDCPVLMTVDRHEMVVIASDGRPVKPVSANTVRLYPGERMDVVVSAAQESGGYWVRVRGTGACSGLQASAMLVYTGFNYTALLDEDQDISYTDTNTPVSAVYGQQLKSYQDAAEVIDVKPVYLGIKRNLFKYADNDFRYISDAIPKKPFFPAPLALKEKGVVQINDKNFLYPNAPILLRPEDVSKDKICQVGEETKQPETQCIQILNAVEGETLEISLVNENVGNESYTFHMHGHGMQVIATGQHFDVERLSQKVFNKLDHEGKIEKNLLNPPIKDTISVPNNGYAIVRVRPNRGGSWLLECRSCGLSLPAAIIVQVPLSLPKAVLDSSPKCGSYRPPDVLLN